jgi:hypothetical protein
VTALPALARGQFTEEMGTAEQLAPLLAAVARAVGQEPLTEAEATVDH